MKAEEKWNNHVIEVLDLEHGKKVIEWWKEQGVDARRRDGSSTKEHNCLFRYYGLIDGTFDNYELDYVIHHNAKIITLPEPFPEKWYMVCTEENQELANEWRRSVATSYKEETVEVGQVFIFPSRDDSYWYTSKISDNYLRGFQSITFEQFKEHVLKQPRQSNKMKITSEQAQQIIDMVSPSCKWKERLIDLWAKNIVLKQEIDVDDSLYKEGYKDASAEQKKVLDGIFGKSKEINLLDGTGLNGMQLFNKGINFGQNYLISVTMDSNDSFWLTEKMKWRIEGSRLLFEPK